MAHTPWLGLRFAQADGDAPLVRTGEFTTEVHLARTPFELVLPVHTEDDVYRLTAWTDASVFDAADVDSRRFQNRDNGTPFYFSDYTAMADTAAGSGTLFINDEGHHFLQGLRLGPVPERHMVYVADMLYLGGGERRESRIEDQRDPLYLVVWYDDDEDGSMDHIEYEFLILHFDRALGPGTNP